MNEDQLEQIVLDLLGELSWEHTPGAAVAPGSGERESWKDPVLHGTLNQALMNLNPGVPHEILMQAKAEVLTPKSQDVVQENFRLHQILVNGYAGITYVDHNGEEQTPTIHFISASPARNRYHAINQLTVVRGNFEGRFDVVLYINGLPISIIELKKSGSANATVEGAYNQLSTYVKELPQAFATCMLVLASDGIFARYGTPFTPWNHFAAWNVNDNGEPVNLLTNSSQALLFDGLADNATTELDLALYGLYATDRIGDLLRNFVTYTNTENGLEKRIAKPHQYWAVTKALKATLKATQSDGRAGVVWHTQGSGKSMEMELYAAKAMREPELKNPTIILITDRTELDSQLFDQFNASELLPEAPIRVASRKELRTQLAERLTGGIYFTTLQKFGLEQAEREGGLDHPELSTRRNIIVIADEAHRSHYDTIDGYARHLRNALPHATLIAFTGTPIAEGERDTRQVFGPDIDVYDLNRAVNDGATVPVYFEPRFIELTRVDGIDDDELNEAAEELTAGLDDIEKARIQQQVAQLDTLYGSPQRIATLAKDFVEHWERRRETMQAQIGGPGKAMIVTSTRNIAAKLYDAIVELRPDWHSDEDAKGKIKVVYSAAPSDPDHLKVHMRRPSQQETVKKRVKNHEDELEIVIVKDMMLTGFDAPALHTLYLDRKIKGALLMQTLARVNRTHRGKEAGLLVGYTQITENLTKALQEFTRDVDPSDPNNGRRTIEEAVDLTKEYLKKVEEIVAPVDWRAIAATGGKRGWFNAVATTTQYLRSPRTPGNSVDGKPHARPLGEKFRSEAGKLARSFALAGGSQLVEPLRNDVKFYEEVRVWMMKLDAEERIANGQPLTEEMRRMLGDLIADTSKSTGVTAIYDAAGLDIPRIDDLTISWERDAVKKGRAELAIEKLRNDILREARKASGGNDIREKAFADRVNDLMVKYANGQLTEAEIIARLREVANDVLEEHARGEKFSPALNTDELTFYDLLANDPEAVDVLGDDILGAIARDIVAAMRRDTKTDWTVREDVRAKLSSTVKRILRKYGYPPSKQKDAVVHVLERMEQMAPRYAG